MSAALWPSFSRSGSCPRSRGRTTRPARRPAPATESQVADLQAADTAGFVERETVASEKGYSDTTIDTSANSAAADFGFDTPFVDATEDDPVAADPLEGWVGTVPGELLMWTDDPDEWNDGGHVLP